MNRRASKRAAGRLNKGIPVFVISENVTVKLASAMLWWDLQMALDPKLKERGVAGDFPGILSAVKPTTLHNRTVREILSYMIESEPSDPSYKLLLENIHKNL